MQRNHKDCQGKFPIPAVPVRRLKSTKASVWLDRVWDLFPGFSFSVGMDTLPVDHGTSAKLKLVESSAWICSMLRDVSEPFPYRKLRNPIAVPKPMQNKMAPRPHRILQRGSKPPNYPLQGCRVPIAIVGKAKAHSDLAVEFQRTESTG